jgi:hypothetical protein
MSKTPENKITCAECGTTIPSNMLFHTSSLFIPSGYIPFCIDCLCKKIDMRNLEQVDKFFQYADWPFQPNKWLLLCKGSLEPQAILQSYYKLYIAQMYKEGYAEKVDWKTATKELMQLAEQGKLVDSLSEEKQKKYEKELRSFWEVDAETPQYTIQQLENLQKLYADLERTQNATGMQTDQAKKLCRLSLDMDIAQRNHELELYAKLMNAYTALVKVAEFTPKSSQSSSSFESVGELVAFLEKTGFINKFYDGEERDIVDKTIKSQQIFLRRIVSGESGLSEKIEQRLQRMQLLDKLEDGTTSEEEWSYDLQHDEDWIDSDGEDYSDPDEEEELDIGEE